MIASPFSSPVLRLAGRWRGSLLAGLLLLTGCPAAPIQITPPPVPVAQWEINGLMHCAYQGGILSGCALDNGVTLDRFANSLLQGTTVTE